MNKKNQSLISLHGVIDTAVAPRNTASDLKFPVVREEKLLKLISVGTFKPLVLSYVRAAYTLTPTHSRTTATQLMKPLAARSFAG